MTGRRAQQRRVAMERSTVQNASYRPIAVSARCRPPRAAPAQRRVPFGTATVYREAYPLPSTAAAVGPTGSSAPRDHAFLAGDRTSRFRDTSYQTDYTAARARVASSSPPQKRGNDYYKARHSHALPCTIPGPVLFYEMYDVLYFFFLTLTRLPNGYFPTPCGSIVTADLRRKQNVPLFIMYQTVMHEENDYLQSIDFNETLRKFVNL